jgi:hypothetical protein
MMTTRTGSSSTEKLNSSPHMGFLEPGTIELHQQQHLTLDKSSYDKAMHIRSSNKSCS